MTTDSEDCSFTLTSDDEERRLSLTHSAKKSTVLSEKDMNAFEAPPEPTNNTTTHNDDDFLSELMKENQQLEAELAAATGQRKFMEKCSPRPEPYPALPPLQTQLVDESAVSSKKLQCTSYTSPTTARNSLKENIKENEPLNKKCRSLQLRLTGAQKAMKNLEAVNKEKDEIIAKLKGELGEGLDNKEEKEMRKRLEMENKELKEEVKELKEIANNYGAENDELRREMQELKSQSETRTKREMEEQFFDKNILN
eukprot:TRINITY_DN297_c0_g1_i12.p9 TRINITY_DN297_c0_g1~~TRINITY_DN297_c0_g1_i12.p9  ORF type:complete len:254 (-),score=44.96 TRINITY_DN297_c0_g1_i12:5150-5911(-)